MNSSMSVTKCGRTFWLMVVLGAMVWLLGVVILRIAGERLYGSADTTLLGLGLLGSFAQAYIFIRIAIIVAKIEKDRIFEALSIASFTALLLDGMALTFFREITYGSNYQTTHYLAAGLLWTFGVTLLMAYFMTARRS